MGKTFAWSFSQLENFEGCPWRWYNESWAKTVPYVQTDAAKWGDQVHKALERRIGPQKLPLPSNMTQYEKFALPVIAAEANGARLELEQKLAISQNWEPTTYFGPTVWCRSIADWLAEKGTKGILGDWKTGKPKSTQQLDLSAAVIMAHKPYLTQVTSTFIWIGEQQAEPTKKTILREQVPDIRASFLPRVKAMTDAINNNRFIKKPSGLCGYCSVGRANCEHWKGYGRK